MTDAEKAATLVELVKDIRIAMLTTVDDEGHLTARPMAQQDVQADGDLWFFVEKSSPTAANLVGRPQAGVALSSNDTWVSLSGTAEIVDDVARAKELWNPWVEAWLPQGPEDDSVALVHFRAEAGEYWETAGGRVASALSFVKAKVTGDRYDGGTNETVTLPN
ncbi:pyridoxamine 5'-phosphate oxidase family protein [uncultured Jatrophihabitans sp.]|uniref:pyridoxamine 5'-phosphate oxidase family protein n=1 Tax=uncultured Jatrophihabitans sp. TaxID=1610747 RepID=UPI0035C9D5F7